LAHSSSEYFTTLPAAGLFLSLFFPGSSPFRQLSDSAPGGSDLSARGGS
jgi:hypothetical protein